MYGWVVDQETPSVLFDLFLYAKDVKASMHYTVIDATRAIYSRLLKVSEYLGDSNTETFMIMPSDY